MHITKTDYLEYTFCKKNLWLKKHKPELSYNDLAIHEGCTASASWATLTDPTISSEAREQLKKDMLAYCGLDTYVMIAIYRKFAEVSSTPLNTDKIS